VCYSTTNPLSKLPLTQNPGVTEGPPVEFSRKLRKVQTFIVTAAQNNTRVHASFWESLLRAAEHYDAELLVIPLRYRNPTAPKETDANGNPRGDYWAKAVEPYLYNVRARLNKNLSVLGDIKIQPTAVEPLTGLEGFTGSESTIVGHTKLSLRTVPTPGHKMAKIMTTTGACTVKNYSDTRAGKHGDFHHTLGACLVEIDGPYFWLRQLNANSRGEFTDLGVTFTPTSRILAPPPAALVLGDTHVDFVCPEVQKATFGKGGMVPTLKPKAIIYHDTLDGYSANPHHAGNPFNRVAKRNTGKDDVEAEVIRAVKYLKENTPPGCVGYVVPSNHDRFLTRWVAGNDWRLDPTNAEFYLETALAMVKSTRMGTGGTEYVDPFPYWINRWASRNIICVGEKGLTIAGIELGMHGDIGPNGARGSIRNLRRIGAKSVIGHSHSPGISEGCYQTGTSSRLQLEYNHGPSGWLNTHCIVHADGKRQLITIVNGRWRR
jgi:hypothetical protein